MHLFECSQDIIYLYIPLSHFDRLFLSILGDSCLFINLAALLSAELEMKNKLVELREVS